MVWYLCYVNSLTASYQSAVSSLMIGTSWDKPGAYHPATAPALYNMYELYQSVDRITMYKLHYNGHVCNYLGVPLAIPALSFQHPPLPSTTHWDSTCKKHYHLASNLLQTNHNIDYPTAITETHTRPYQHHVQHLEMQPCL